MQSNHIGFSWYTGNIDQNQTTSFGPSTSIPIEPSNSCKSGSGYSISIDNGQSLPIQHFDRNTPLTINAQNVYINEINEEGHHSLRGTGNQEGTKTEVKEFKSGDIAQTAKSTSVASDDGKAKTTTTETKTPTSSTDRSKKIEMKETTSTNNPVEVPFPSHSAAPNGTVQPSTAPGASSTTRDGIHTTPLSGTPGSDKYDTKPSLSTSNPAPVLPHDADHPAAPSSNKKNKPHKGLKEKFKDWRMHRKSGGTPANADVHPKDSRDGKVLPSEAELGKYMDLGGDSAIGSEGSGLPKDKLDSTGKTVTGSDANPSKKTNPFKAPTPTMTQAPVEAKSQ